MTCEIEGKVRNLGEVFHVNAPFNDAIVSFREQNLEIISARDLAYARINGGFRFSPYKLSRFKKSHLALCYHGSYVKEGVILLPKDDRVILLRNSLILEDLVAAVDAHKKNKNYPVDETKLIEILIGSTGTGSMLILKTPSEPIPTNQLSEHELTAWLYQDQAREYGLFLSELGVKDMPVYFDDANVPPQKQTPCANQLWLGGVNCRSDIYGVGNLSQSKKVRAIKKRTNLFD